MQVSFVQPSALWLLLILPLFWALFLAVPRRLPPRRFWLSLGLRSTILAALILALAGMQLVRPVDDLTTVFLLDSSDSITPEARARAEQFIQDSVGEMKQGDRAAVVVFGENALVERTPSDDRALGPIQSIPVVARTNIQDALTLGMALFPSDTGKRIVLLSDGGENAGQARDASQLAAARGIPITYLDLSAAAGGEALLSDLSAPTTVRQGQEFDLIATIESSVAQSVRLQIFGQSQGQETLLHEQYKCKPGQLPSAWKLTADAQGFERYRAQIEPQTDTRAQNNQASALVRVDGVPQVLLVEGQPGEAENLGQALTAAHVEVTTVAPNAVPTDMAGLSDHEAVVLVNTPAKALPVRTLAALAPYVHDLGRGLIMIGGDRSYGVGGYSKTPVEDALPVYMDVRDKIERPDLALVFVIDKSGSMDACHCSGPNRQSSQAQRGGARKIDIAKDAVAQAAAVLREQDTIGVVAFDGSAHWVLPAQKDPSTDTVLSSLAPVAPEGGTNVRAGLQAAQETLKQVDARIKHVILLTDGWSGGNDNLDIATEMNKSGITLSVVAAGSGSAEYLQRLAETGGGRYYPAERMEDVPQIFVQETINVLGNYVVEQPFTPVQSASSPLVNDLTAVPQLYGYNGTTAKETATVALSGPDNAPVLAEWQYGLGHSIAWTSDAKGKWAKDWVQWQQFPHFAAQLVDRVLPRTPTGGLSATVHSEGAQTVIDVQASSADGQPLDDAELNATIVGANGFSEPLQLKQVASGKYRATTASPVQGTYMIQLVGKQDDQIVAQDTIGMVVPYSPEYRQGQNNPELLQTLAANSGGAQLRSPVDSFAPLSQLVTRAQEISLQLLLLALILLPIDIGVRRMSLRREDFSLAAIAAARGAASSDAASAAAPPKQTPDQERLERLLDARERARRRARGEE